MLPTNPPPQPGKSCSGATLKIHKFKMAGSFAILLVKQENDKKMHFNGVDGLFFLQFVLFKMYSGTNCPIEERARLLKM